MNIQMKLWMNFEQEEEDEDLFEEEWRTITRIGINSEYSKVTANMGEIVNANHF